MPLPSCLVPLPRDPVRPAFTLAEHATVTDWRATVRRRGLRTELDTDHASFEEVFCFLERGADVPRWMLTKELDGSAGLTWCLDDCGGDTYATVAEALAVILATLDDEDDEDEPG